MATPHTSAAPSYAELQVTTNFSFLTGGSHAEELVAQAKALGLAALAVADRNTLAGVVRAHVAAKEVGLRLIIGARLDLEDAPSLLCFPKDRAAYGRLCRMLSLGQGRAEKGKCSLRVADVARHCTGSIFIALPPDGWDWREAARTPADGAEIIALATKKHLPLEGGGRNVTDLDRAAVTAPQARTRSKSDDIPGGGEVRAAVREASPPPSRAEDELACATVSAARPEQDQRTPTHGAASSPFEGEVNRIKSALAGATLYLAASHTYCGDDRARIAALAAIAARCGTPLVATNDVLYHALHRRPLQDVLTCIRAHTTIHEAGLRLAKNAERHLKRASEMARLFRGYEDALARSVEIADACRFSLDELVYEYPDEPVPPGATPQAHLETLTWEGAAHRFPDGLPEKVRATIIRELQLVAELGYAPYFLTVHDIVGFARSHGILCQGRGSAANSVVCYCLGITAVNPTEVDLLFERFVSHARKEPPDIDVDFEHDRREEVIQYIYARYGRDRAGLAATVISYRARSAVRDVGKAMGLSEDTVSALAGMVWGTRSGGALGDKRVREAGLDPQDPLLARVLELTEELIGFPRHLSQHVGGFVLTRGPLVEMVPVGNAAMEDRTFIEWDKDDIAALGLLKVDVLALGMLSAIRRAFDLLRAHHGLDLNLAKVPRDDAATYDMLCKADSVGVFQVESRAQMNMLPRLKPRTFYDLVIEVAIVRPGPIQGDMVHPYLRRRSGVEEESYPSPSPEHGPPDELRQILGKTKGVPLFQEQAMRIAMVAAEFSDAEVNELRKAMATFRRRGTIGLLEEQMVERMTARGYPREFAQRCFNQIKGFGEYGFPESHAASFAHLVYVSAWLKCHYPAAFACALLNSQPMGFYAPAQIVRCARDHGVEVREADVNLSDWDSTLESEHLPLEAGGRNFTGLAGPAMAVQNARGPAKSDEIPGGGGERAAAREASPPPSRAQDELACSPQVVALNEQGSRTLTHGAASSPFEGEVVLRLGLRQIDGLQEVEIARLVAARGGGRLPLEGGGRNFTDLDRAAVTAPQARARAKSDEIPGGGGERAAAREASPPPSRAEDELACSEKAWGIDGTSVTRANSWRGVLPPRGGGGFRSVHDLWMRAGVRLVTLEKLAAADAVRSLGVDRRQALWEVKALANAPPLPLFQWSETRETGAEPAVALPEMPLSEHVVCDYQTLRLSLKAHPMSFLRDKLRAQRILSCNDIRACKDGAYVRVAGVVLVRQRPGSAKGVVFMTIEDETGVANAVVWPKALEKFRKVVMAARLILITGRVQRHEDIIHIVSTKLEDKSDRLAWLSEWAADEMKIPIANADEVSKPGPDPATVEAGTHPRWSGHPRNGRIIPKSRDFH